MPKIVSVFCAEKQKADRKLADELGVSLELCGIPYYDMSTSLIAGTELRTELDRFWKESTLGILIMSSSLLSEASRESTVIGRMVRKCFAEAMPSEKASGSYAVMASDCLLDFSELSYLRRELTASGDFWLNANTQERDVSWNLFMRKLLSDLR